MGVHFKYPTECTFMMTLFWFHRFLATYTVAQSSIIYVTVGQTYGIQYCFVVDRCYNRLTETYLKSKLKVTKYSLLPGLVTHILYVYKQAYLNTNEYPTYIFYAG